jgi:hypothetical protein
MSVEAAPAVQVENSARPWWETRWCLALVVLATVIPLLYPRVPPLVDLLGHMGRYRVELDIGRSPWLADYYGFHWAAIGNLGVDILVIPLGKLIGLEAAVKLIVLMIPPLTVAGFFWVAFEVHGRVPPTAFFAVPFAYCHPFLFGFVNFALSMALAFLAFGLWLRLGRLGRIRERCWLFVPISVLIFFCHTYGWGALGLLCFSAEAVRQHDRGVGWLRAGLHAALQASVMALPILVMLIWRSETHGGMTGDWFNWEAKWRWFEMSFRDRWKVWDIASLAVCVAVLLFAAVSRRLTFSRNLAFTGLVLLAGYLILPRVIFGSAYADMRLIPYVVAVGLLAIRSRGDMGRRLGGTLALLGIAFVVLRIGSTTASLGIAANEQNQRLEALDRVPMGARVATLVGDPCGEFWPLPRDSHLGAMVIVRRQGFSNDQWVMEGVNLLDLRYSAAGHFASDPSQRIRRNGCGVGPLWSIDHALRDLPRGAFDYVWLVNIPPFDHSLTTGLRPVWRGTGSILYQVDK